jgi:hypothetical protein
VLERFFEVVVTPVTPVTPGGGKDFAPDSAPPAAGAGPAASDSPYGYYNEIFQKAAERHAGRPTVPPLAEKLSVARVKELTKWWRRRTKELRAELSPALVKDQARKDLREVLAEELVPGAVDSAVKQVVQAATSKKPAAKRRSRR